jgi:predicted RNase H-like nuclease (RuvC/YqgF family)
MTNIDNQNSENQGLGWKVASIIMGVLLIGSIAFGVMFYNKHNESAHKAMDLSSQLDNTRTKLQGELATLNSAYTGEIATNDTLSSELQQKVSEVADLQDRINKAKKDLKSSLANNKEIQGRLAQMEDLKVALEKDIADLRDQNVALAASNHDLNTELTSTKDEVVNLNTKVMSLTAANSKLTSRLKIVAPAGFTADNFTVTSEDKRDKLTTRGKKIDQINVKFDLNNIPEELQGGHEIYLVLTQFNGNPVTVVPGKDVNLTFGEQSVSVHAADLEQIDLKDRQVVNMSFEPTDNMTPGTYNLMVYSDTGYLGSTGFMVSK